MKVDNFVAPLTENNTTLKANSFMQWERWIEKGDFRSKTKSCILTQSKKFLNPTASLTTPENTRSHPTKQLRDAGLTATAAAAAAHSESAWQMLFSARQQRVPASDRSSACYR